MRVRINHRAAMRPIPRLFTCSFFSETSTNYSRQVL